MSSADIQRQDQNELQYMPLVLNAEIDKQKNRIKAVAKEENCFQVLEKIDNVSKVGKDENEKERRNQDFAMGFKRKNIPSQCFLNQMKNQIKALIVVTMYNEDNAELQDTLEGIFDNLLEFQKESNDNKTSKIE